ncbi:hypothetical protein PISMIDRAFT_12007 [Pisolithus microcarpus 441]|uniref:Uncharacterized protein n=1 Tax=Pisolithus microcarpus 441 TaxID=765257 RepID=A0A0C9Z752_9AGAM|nr:hypothetical protein PISMIDRAFT_12007 [Pisolithus microcarpus 441]
MSIQSNVASKKASRNLSQAHSLPIPNLLLTVTSQQDGTEQLRLHATWAQGDIEMLLNYVEDN